jgi:hypothetical protein
VQMPAPLSCFGLEFKSVVKKGHSNSFMQSIAIS